jgi:hypothetical protein
LGLAERFGADDLIGGGRAPRGPRGRAPRGRAPRDDAGVGVGAFVGIARFLETGVGATVEDGVGRFFVVVVVLAVVFVFVFLFAALASRLFLFKAISSIIDIGFFGIGFWFLLLEVRSTDFNVLPA